VPVAAADCAAIAAGGAHSLALSSADTATLGRSTILLAGAPSVRGTTYQWQFDGQNITGATNSFLLLPFVHWTNAGDYRVVGSNVFGTFASQSSPLAVQRTPLRFDTSPEAFGLTPEGLRLRLTGAAGLSPVVVHATTDFLSWEPVYTNPPVIGAFELFDAGITNRPQTFYRASEVSPP
jgi:hypothetical protein